MNDHQTYAYFYVKGFQETPDEISSLLDLCPTKFWSKGEVFGINNSRQRKENFWSFRVESSVDDYYSNVHFEELLDLLEPKYKNLKKLSQNAKIGLTYVSTCYYSNVAVILTNDILTRISKLGLSLDYDIYSLNHEIE